MLSLTPQASGQDNVMAVRASGILSFEDYKHFTDEMERRMRQHGRVRVLFDLDDFHGWSFGAAWADFTFGLKHLGQLERCAVVGDKKWEEWLTDVGKPFFKVRYFDRAEEAQAREWLRQPDSEADTPLAIRVADLAARHPLACVAGSVAAGFLVWGLLRSRSSSR